VELHAGNYIAGESRTQITPGKTGGIRQIGCTPLNAYTQNSLEEFRQTVRLNSQVVSFPEVRRMTNMQKHEEAGVLFRNY
jgi:hypothetical protein